MTSRLLSTLLLALLYVAPSLASATTSLNGLAAHDAFGQEQFICGLFVSKKTSDAKEVLLSNTDKMIQIRITNEEGLVARRHKTIWLERLAVNTSAAELSSVARDLANFEKMLSIDLNKDDILSISRRESLTLVVLNGVELGRIQGAQFFDYFLRVFLGPVPLSSKLRESLLQAGNVNQNMIGRFEQAVPTEIRIEEVKSLVSSARAKKNAPIVQAPKLKQKELPKKVVKKQNIPDSKTKITPKKTKVVKQPEKNKKKIIAKPLVTKEDIVAEEIYVKNLKKKINTFLVYPPALKSSNIERTLILKIEIDAGGVVKSIKVRGRDKEDAFAKQAVESINKAAPFDQLPKHLKQSGLSLSFRVAYKVRRIQRVYEAYILD